LWQRPAKDGNTETPMIDILSYIVGIATFVCFVMIVVKMFQSGSTGLGIVTIISFCLCGIGCFVALIFGWLKASEWNIKPLMAIYTVLLLVHLGIIGYTFPENYDKFQKQYKEQMEQQKR
jgi:hypothetical protein